LISATQHTEFAEPDNGASDQHTLFARAILRQLLERNEVFIRSLRISLTSSGAGNTASALPVEFRGRRARACSRLHLPVVVSPCLMKPLVLDRLQLTDRGSEYCGNPERHEYELYLAVGNIDHSRTKTKSPQTNGICERFHKTVLNEFYRVAFGKKVYRSIDELQADLDVWIREYNEERPHQGRWCFGKTPMQTFHDAMPMTKEKMLAA
jgi:hypothetical protein